ncbi:M28 family peptidase [Actinocrispum wychmicini]|uniref:Zn-dependent M28 family amino/carboxypeptidase n=1 Tax=Actinocrispum wychmicini TaxID=1213861 RepID=A0A4R2JU70_9PSEU|nr:M28 family peptidase [Actinocrispum wychmicini]TCO60559.1 Zn-dependent M28 family amino/carboxypeptidase [Actinocrispum wychmicini]
MSRRRAAVAVTGALVAVMASGVIGPPASASPNATPAGPALARELAHQVSPGRINDHLEAFQRISNRNGGDREPGTEGYRQSVDYAARKLDRAGYTVTRQDFQFNWFQTLAEKLTAAGANVPVIVMDYGPSTPVGGVTAPLVVVPSTGDATPGCEASDYANIAAAGKIVLVERGACSFIVKQQTAAAAGAIATLIYNNVDGPLNGSLNDPSNGRVPTGGLSRADGLALTAQAGTTISLELRSLQQVRTSANLIAQTRTGREDNVVTIGGHLDSIGGAGISDNATGAAAMLETALRLGSRPRVTNAVRFIFFSAQEFSFAGATAYLNSLGADGQHKIGLYLNVEMLGSPNAGYFVLHGLKPAGSDKIEQAFVDYFTATRVQSETAPMSSRWDYNAFANAGIPTGGLFTGADSVKTQAQVDKWGGTAGQPFDVCYQLACDNLRNVDRVALNRNARALAWVIGSYATSTQSVNGR